MTISIPLIAVAAILAYIAYRYAGLRIWQAVVCMLVGFLLAATGAAPEINNLIYGIIHWLQRPGG